MRPVGLTASGSKTAADGSDQVPDHVLSFRYGSLRNCLYCPKRLNITASEFNPGETYHGTIGYRRRLRTDRDHVYAGYDCTADWPGASFWRPLSEHYPEARIILTMRPVESWWESYSNTIMKFFLEMLPQVPDDHVRNTGNMAKKVISKWAFGTADIDDRKAATAAYEAHVAAVSDAFSDDRLLKFDVREGWEPLCAFLDKPVREGEFPRSNSSEEFWEIVKPRD